MQIRVYYEDTDTGGVVYHSNYLNFCERARSEAFFSRGLSPVLENGHFVAKRVEGDYISSAKLGDTLEITSELLEMRGASFTLRQSIFRGDEKVFELVIILVYISFEGRPQKLDTQTKELILELFES
ncbi:MAG: YbgC/FadM family acyl-CoA thioesterase [Sulfurimonas sp.]|jgi:acyl-CoA thioester hydrolase|nr:YbgC/FadM family acyl-CoA thioesterase [Sulfurimonas sp.]